MNRGWIVSVSIAASFAIGLVFIFVWTPHPFGWYGIDQYHQLAIELAQGRPFSTLDVPWGYPYFLAAFYRVFGPTPLPALLAQVALNALIPALVYRFARETFDARVAAVAALLTAVLSFNTVYASTESTDSVATFLFMALLVLWNIGRRNGRWPWFAACGLLCGIAAQFRPNLLLLPLVLAALQLLFRPGTARSLRDATLIVAVAALTLMPWTIRNRRLAGQFIPTSTHGGVQLWYGTLQAGPYLDSRAYNPRSIFETPVFDYSSLLNEPVLFDIDMNCGPGIPQSIELVHWTDTDSVHQRLQLQHLEGRHYQGSLPPAFRPTRIYYYVSVHWPSPPVEVPEHVTPEGGAADPLVYFVSDDHLGDLDADDMLLDVFDLARLLRHIAWGEPVRAADKLDFDHNGRLDEADFRTAARFTLSYLTPGVTPPDRVRTIITTATEVRAQFDDGSELAVPRRWSGGVTELRIDQGVASALMHARYRFAQPRQPRKVPLEIACLGPGGIAINQPFYRVQPHEMRRYSALAFDNIRRDPIAYARSVFYRAWRLFVVHGTEDRQTAQQFTRSRLVYLAATAASAIYLVLFLAGVIVGWRKGYPIWIPVALIAYIPATIAFVLTNMRYTITVQPLMFIFVAISLVAVGDWAKGRV
jgi:dolichyl-phosphate-mannose-protein mannosyltransferase